MTERSYLRPASDRDAQRESVEQAAYQIRRVIAGQDQMLERVFVCLLAGGHLLIEGVPGLAKTLTIKTVAEVLGGTFRRVQFTPDLVPSDIVGTRVYRSGTDTFDTELGPVFCNFLLADEINRAPAKVQSALLEVMQERQVTLGTATHPVPSPFLVMATQNPIESEGTYPLPEAQVDRFMLKVIVDYPAPADELTVIERALVEPAVLEQILSIDGARSSSSAWCARSTSTRWSQRYALRLALATRDLAGAGLAELAPYVEFGVSPRGPINLVLPRGRSRSCAAGATSCPRTSASSRRTSCATASCSPTTRSPRTSTRTRSSIRCSRPCRRRDDEFAKRVVA